MELKIYLENGAFRPYRKHTLDSGYDLFTPEAFTLEPGEIMTVDTRVHIGIPKGHDVQITGRSGLAAKGIMVFPGTVDRGYSGTLGVTITNLGKTDYEFYRGDRIAQMVTRTVGNPALREVEELKELEIGDRGDKGFGSTGV